MTPFDAIQVVFQDPPIPYESEKHTLKGWAKYCLQARGFKVVYAERADFAVETSDRQKLYFKVTTKADDLDPSVGWIIWQGDRGNAQVLPPG